MIGKAFREIFRKVMAEGEIIDAADIPQLTTSELPGGQGYCIESADPARPLTAEEAESVVVHFMAIAKILSQR